MTEEQKQRIFKKAKEHALEAKKNGTDFVFPGDPWANDSLAKVIKTKEQADRFMTLLELEIAKDNNPT
jgi:hypothetical protein